MSKHCDREDVERDATTLRALRHQLHLSQPAFAVLLDVNPESYRTWDAGRRPVPATVLAKAHDLARAASGVARPLYAWAASSGIHVRTLRQAALDGRLEVTYSPHVFFGHAVPLATGAAVHQFKTRYYCQTTRWNRPPRPSRSVPIDYDQRLIAGRQQMGLSQAALAAAMGAANRSVVYQWESRRRTPSSFFWRRFVALRDAQGSAWETPQRVQAQRRD
jgi:DNA-binding transcriptional regulator YiaG